MRYLPGSHKRGIREYSGTTAIWFLQASSDYGDEDRAAEVAMYARPGDLLVQNSLIVHRANGISVPSDRARRWALLFSCDMRRKTLKEVLNIMGG